MINTMYFLLRLLLEIYKYYWNAILKLMNNEEMPKKKKVEMYVEKESKKFMELFKNEKDMNSSIVKEIYDSKLFKELLSDSDNLEEKKWKTRIMYENVYREDDKNVGIMMYYDLYKQGFVYYSNDSIISYRVLNAAAMKYVRMYNCIDFFMDEKIVEDCGKKLELKKVFYEEEKKKKDNEKKEEEKDNRDVFAKLKNYKKEEKTKDEKNEKEKEYIRNKFICSGKMYDFNILKKENKVSNIETSYDGMFKNDKLSYKDYKNLKLNN